MRLAWLCAAIVCVAAACSTEQPPLVAGQLQIARPVGGMSMGAGYLALKNNSDQSIVITRVHSPDLESVEMHESIQEDGVSRMVKLPEVAIPPGQSVTFEPGAKHLMLRYPTAIPSRITLQFFAEETLMLSVGATIED